jgi:hypothetical protein
VDRRTQVGIGTTHRPMRQEKLDTATADSIEFWTIASPHLACVLQVEAAAGVMILVPSSPQPWCRRGDGV